MALYSVWDWNRNAYRVYSTRRPVSVGDDPIPPRPSGLSALGADPDEHIKPLPSGARFEGYSHLARGEIRRMPTGMGDTADDAGAASGGGTGKGLAMMGIGILIGAGAVWWYENKKR